MHPMVDATRQNNSDNAVARISALSIYCEQMDRFDRGNNACAAVNSDG